MIDRRFLLAVVSALMATQNNTSEAATAAAPDTNREHAVRAHGFMAEQEAVVALFDDCRYEKVIETASAIWPRLDAMPDKVLYCVAECYVRTGQPRLAKTGFELLIARSPQNHSYRAGLAYTLLYAGEVDKGLAMYRQVLTENQATHKGAAEDAVALLSQGNIGGGKLLFKMVIAISPDKQKYLQWYEQSLCMYGLADDAAGAKERGQAASAKAAVPSKNEQIILHSQAVELANSGQYQQSLDIMAGLLKTDGQDKSVVSDYIIILQQAGQNERAVNLYEQHSAAPMPFSVIRSVSKAYFQLHEYDKALAVLQPAIFSGEHDALLLAGEMHLRRGNMVGAQLYYERLLTQNPNDFEAYFSRGMLSFEVKDYRQAASDLERARRIMPDGPDKSSRLLKLEHCLALAYMNFGQNQKAASILKNYTEMLPVDNSLAGDYITALGNNAQYELAVREGERLWPAYAEGFVPGLRSLAESYIRLGKKEQALAVYKHLAGRQPGEDAGWRMLAFQLMLMGRTTEGLGYYDKLLGKADNADEVVADAKMFIATDAYLAGKMLFELVLTKYPNPAYREQYAEILAKKNMSRAAYKQYQLLSGQPEGELAGLSGMARTAYAMGDYPKSRQTLAIITSKYGRSKAVAALDPNQKEPKPYPSQDENKDYRKVEPKAVYTSELRENQAIPVGNFKKSGEPNNNTPLAVKETPEKDKEEFAYEMAQIATKFLSSPVTDVEKFKIEFAYAISTITAKVMPLIPSDQRNQFTYEMAQFTTSIINDQNLDVKKAKAQFARLTTKITNQIDTSFTGEKPTGMQKKDTTDLVTIDPETYESLINELMQVGNRPTDNKIKIDGEIRYHYAANSGSEEWNKDASGLRLYLGAESKINKDWRIFGMLEGQKNIKNYNNKLELSRLYIEGKMGEAKVKAGKFGYLMAEGNIYDSGFTGIKVDAGDPVKYSFSCGETEDTKETYIATARYNDFDYNLETGIYHYQLDDGTDTKNTIWNFGGNYKFNDFSIGAMYLRSSQKDSKGNNDGYVLSFNYGDLREYRPGTYNLSAKYYNQPRYTYISHGMNGKANSMQGVKGYGLGVNYTVAKDYVVGIEYYNLKDKISGEKGKTFWTQLTHYF